MITHSHVKLGKEYESNSGKIRELPSNFANVHDVFHVSQLGKCFKTPERTLNF